MEQALREARGTLGRTWPNPPVGAVLVKDGLCIARGATQIPGHNHAERECLARAGDSAHGATLYVTLEPCSHHGRTPPCTEAVIQSRVARVVVATLDPNPLVSGQGIRSLRDAGIAVETGCLEEEARNLMQPFFKYITTGRPWIVAKYAMTLDGRMALDSGDSFWISGEKARAEVQVLRKDAQAILVGGNTVRQDNPRLDCRIASGEWQPARIILTAQGIPPDARLFSGGGPVHILAPEDKVSGILAGLGTRASVHGLSSLDPGPVIAWLGEHGFASVLVEAGPGILTGLVREGYVDRVRVYIAPVMAGGTGMQPIRDIGTSLMQMAPRLRGTWRNVGSDICFEGDFVPEEE